MEDWVHRALARWPNVPSLYGWLSLDRRGHWRIQGEPISRPQIIDTFNRNYAADEHGQWFFQNGPQRGYVALATAPLVLWVTGEGQLRSHTGFVIDTAEAAYLDEHGGLWLQTAHGPAALDDQDLGWLMERLYRDDIALDDAALSEALATPSGEPTQLQLHLGTHRLAVQRLDFSAAPAALGFVRQPAPPISKAAAV